MAWSDYFDGSKFYSRRNSYRKQLLNAGIAVIEEYNLKAFIYDTSGTYTLSDDEYDYYLANKDSYEAELQERFQPTEGTFEINGRVISWTRYGLERYTNIYGEQKARLETSYIMDLISATQVASWIAMLATSIALIAGFFTQLAGWVLYASVISTITSTIAYYYNEIDNLITKAKTLSISAAKLSAELSGAYLAQANSYMANKDLNAGDMQIWLGKEIYAGGSAYMQSGSAGYNNSYNPTKAYNPSENFTGLKIKDPFQTATDYTQGRNHYKLAGNEGWWNQISPRIPLKQINSLDPDLEYKQNSYKNHNERLMRGYSELANYIGSDDDNDCEEWLQSWYEHENENYKNIYYTYAQSKDVIERMKYYQKALRADFDFLSIAELKRKESTSTQTIETDKDTSSYSAPEDLGDDEESLASMDGLDLYLQSKFIESESATSGIYAYYDTESKEFLEYKLTFFESLDLNYFINSLVLASIIDLSSFGTEEEVLDFYVDFATNSQLAYNLSNACGISLGFESSVCKDALGYYFGLFSSEYDADLVLGMDAEEFLNEPYDSHSKVDLGSYSFSLSISTFNGINGTSYSGTLSYDSWGLWGVVNDKNYSIVGYKISSFTLSAELIEKYFDGSDSFTISTEDLGLPYATYIQGLYFKTEMAWYWEDVVRLESITFSLKNKAQIDSVESNIFSDFSYSTSAKGWIEVNEGNEPYFEAYSTFSGSACKANVTWSINSYYDSEDIYTKASAWLESAKAEVQALIKTAKTQAEIESAIAEALEAELEAQTTESESTQAQSESQSESSAQATQSTQSNS